MLSILLEMGGFRKRWPVLSEEDVREHNHRHSLWVVSAGSVYDVTDLICSHPGGSAALLRKGGGAADCTADYVFHSRYARKQWAVRKVGELEPAAAARLLSSAEQRVRVEVTERTPTTGVSLSFTVASTSSRAPVGYCECSHCCALLLQSPPTSVH